MPEIETNKDAKLQIAKIKEQLDLHHAGKPMVLDCLTEIDQIGLAETHYDSYDPGLERYAYVQVGGSGAVVPVLGWHRPVPGTLLRTYRWP